MDFARKQLEKYGWKDGHGLGKDCQGMAVALKPSLKMGKEGMGFDLSKELTDTWWTKAYSDSLSRIDVTISSTEEVDVKIKDDGHKKKGGRKEKFITLYANPALEERPMEKMRKKMMNANFTSFSKGGTLLTNGEILEEEKTGQEILEEDSTTKFRVLSDKELLKACGGRTGHKAARFGLKLNGKLARIAAQEAADLAAISTLTASSSLVQNNTCDKVKSKKVKKCDINLSQDDEEDDDESKSRRKLEKYLKKKRKRDAAGDEQAIFIG